MRKRGLLIAAIIALASLVAAAGIYAACQDVIKLEDKIYKKHKKGIIAFHHKNHMEVYAKKFPDIYKNGCGECHHDKDNKPLSQLTCDDKVQKCSECHKKPGEMPKAEKRKLRKEKLSKKEMQVKLLAYHAEAYHLNCRGCHKAYNKQYKPDKKNKAPTSCTKCHPKKK